MGGLAELCASLRAGRGFAHKGDIAGVLGTLEEAWPGGSAGIANGDDCAALPDGDGHLLFAIEGFLDDFVQAQPWFSGWCGVMVNLSDIAAMGGRPLAVVDALWSPGAEPAQAVLQGLAAAARHYGVPVVGGHSNCRAPRAGLAVAVLGRAQRLLTSFAARPGDTLVMAIDLRGAYEGEQPFWNAATGAPPERARADLALLPALAEAGLADAAKDISMAGAAGTALMLLEGSGVGGTLDVDAIPRPAGVPLLRWLQTFPSFGFVLALRPARVDAVLERFAARGIAAAPVGEVHAARRLVLRRGDEQALLWDLDGQPFVGARPTPEPAHA
ncbi:MAG: sll0787 family AIR synthase-like protein [Piscinibacter sp.]|nr:sll0787 family AIR synthase-like protein [Piscinibacter sp.]